MIAAAAPALPVAHDLPTCLLCRSNCVSNLQILPSWADRPHSNTIEVQPVGARERPAGATPPTLSRDCRLVGSGSVALHLP